jgi:hypothetical protein
VLCCAAGPKFDFETCLKAKGHGGVDHRLTRTHPAEPSTAHLCSASAVPASVWSLDVAGTVHAFLYVVTTQTLGESGLDRWAIRLTSNKNGCENGFGVSAGVDPAEALAMSTTKGPTSVEELTECDQRFVLMSTDDTFVYYRDTHTGAVDYDAAPPGAVLHAAQTEIRAGTVVTFQVDRKANALLVQTHRPNCDDRYRALPQPGTAPSAKDAVAGRVPSQVQRVQLPAGVRWEDLRPTLTLWYVPRRVLLRDTLRLC